MPHRELQSRRQLQRRELLDLTPGVVQVENVRPAGASPASQSGIVQESLKGSKMPTFRDVTELLIYMYKVQYSQGLLLSEALRSLQRIEMKLNGYVDPKLSKAIAQLDAKADQLKEAIDEQNESSIGKSTWPARSPKSPEGESVVSADLSDEIQAVQNANTVIGSATTLINGFQARLDAAVAEALANGATAAELQPLSDLSVELKTQTQALADAVVANTPAA